MAKINTTNYRPITAWNGTQDLLIVEQPDGTKVATPEQIRQYILSNMDDAPTEGSENIVSSGGVATSLSNVQEQIDTLHGDYKTIIPANADINDIQYTAVKQYTTSGNGKNIQNVPDAVKNVSFYMIVINSLTNETVQISSAWKERTQIIIPIDASVIYIREVKSNASASDITYGSWRTVLTDSDSIIKDISSQATIDSDKVSEFNAFTYGKLIYIHLKLKAGVADQTNVVTNLPYRIKGNYGVLPMFFMNSVDAATNGVCAYIDKQIQYRGSTTTGSGGTMYSGMFLLS